MSVRSCFPEKPRHRVYSLAWRADCLAHVERELAAGKSLGDIARELDMSDTTLMRWMSMAGVPVPERPRKGVDRAAICATASEMRKSGMSIKSIAQQLGCCEKRLSGWLRGDNDVRPRSDTARKIRFCLKCRGEFYSAGAHNRMCDKCRAHAHILSPMEPSPGGDAGRRVGRAR